VKHMPEKSGFFDSIAEDPREYTADEFAEYFRRVLTDGIFNGGTNLQVTADGTNMNVNIADGYAWIQGYMYKVYDGHTLTLDTADPTLNRIDRIVLRLDKSLEKRSIEAVVLKGTPSATPTPPVLTRNDNVYEISLAQVEVIAGKSFIEGFQVTDERLDTNVCGLVNSLIQADTTEIFNQFQEWYNSKTTEFQQEWDDWFVTATATFNADWSNWFTQTQNEWDTYFQSVQNEGYETPSGAQAKVDAAIATHSADYVKHPGYGVATGSANAYAVTLNPAPTSYVEGMAISVKINVDNTGASTINVNGLGAKAIKKPNGNDVSAGNLKAGSIYTLRYNGTNFILQGEGGAGNAQPSDVLSGKTFTNDSGEQVGTMPNHGAIIFTPGTSNQPIPAGYHNGSGYVQGDPDLIASNIKSGVNIFGVTGTLIPMFTLTQKQTISGGFSYHETPQGQTQGWRYNTHNVSFAPKFIVMTFSYTHGTAGGTSSHSETAFWISPEVLGVNGTTVTTSDLSRSANGNGPEAWNSTTQFYPMIITNVSGNTFQIGQASYKTDWTYYKSYFASQSYTVTVYG
jgi:hypothetical protein